MASKSLRVSSLLLLLLTQVHADASQPGYFWHVTDFHYDHSYWTQMLSNSTSREELRSRGIYGNQWLDSPWLLVEDAIENMAAIKPDPDFLIWTGDTVAHIKDKYLSVEANTDILYNVTDALKRHFSNRTVYASFGNHDYWPSNQFPGNGSSAIYNATADQWQEWIVEEEQLANFRKGGYYTLKTPGGVRIVALNTNLYYTSDHQTQQWQDPADQFQWLQSVLTSARTAREKVMLTAHIPPGILGWEKAMWFREPFNTRLLSILRDFSDVITVFHYGHEHSDGFKIIYKNGVPSIPMFSAPSVTPWRYKIPQKTGRGHNPAVRLVKFNRTTGAVLDICQYYLDLRGANARNASAWKLLYNLTSTYGVSDGSASSLHQIRQRMAGGETTLLNTYYTYATVSWEPKTCDKPCQGRIICGFEHQEWPPFNTCFVPYTQGTSRATGHVIIVSLALALFSLLTM